MNPSQFWRRFLRWYDGCAACHLRGGRHWWDCPQATIENAVYEGPYVR